MFDPFLTSSNAPGEVVPIPTLPEASIRIRSVPAVDTATVSAAGKNKPALRSPVWAMDGAAAVPSAKDATPVTASDETVPPTVDAACQVLPFQMRNSLATELKYWSPTVRALPSLSTLGLLDFEPR